MRRWLLVATLAACGIDARGLLEAGGTTTASEDGGPLGQTDGGGGTPTDSGGGGEGSPTIDGAGPSRGRVTDGLILLYELEENGGDVAKDTSGVAPALDLDVPTNVKWIPKALSFDAAALAKTLGPATKIVQRCAATNAITVEAWFRYVNLPDWSRIIAVSESAGVGNVAMTSNPQTIGFDLRSSTLLYERTTRDVHDGGTPTTIVHLVETFDASGVKRVYLNGVRVIDVTQTGSLSTWDATYPLSIGNTPALDRPFFGEIHLVAIYDRALTEAEVVTNRTAGPDP